MTNFYQILRDLWTSGQPPRFARKALVVLFVVESCVVCGAVGVAATGGVELAFHSKNPQREPLKPFLLKANPCNN